MSSLGGRPSTATDDPSAPPPLSSWYAQGFSDGFGDRLLMFDNAATGPLELLRVRADFALVPAFESALRARVDRLAGFIHSGFAQLRSVDHLENGEGLTVTSSHVAGTRLSELFQSSRPHPGMHPASVRWALGELIASLAELHRRGDDVAHGTLSPDHIVITSDRHVVITDYVFGDALAALRLPADRLWSEFGLVAPGTVQTGGLDQRSDVLQAALAMLSLVLGRRVSPSEFPAQTAELIDEFTSACNRRAPDVTPALGAWIGQALDPHGFRNASDAERALVDPVSLPVPAPPAQTIDTVAVQSHETALGATRLPAAAPIEVPVDLPALAPLGPVEHFEHIAEFAAAAARPTWFWIAVAMAAVIILQGAIIVRLLSARASQPARVTIDSASPGDTVLVDGKDVGVTPLDLPLSVVTGAIRVVPQSPEPVPGSVLATSESAQPLTPASPPAPTAGPPRDGGVRISSPVPVQVVEGNDVLGSSSNGPLFLSPGVHQLELVNSTFGYRTVETVRISAGRVLSINLKPPNGSVNINAQPWAQVFIDGRAVGDTPLANLSVPLGEHEVLFRHPQLGERRQKAIVQAGTLTRVSASFTR
jgi:hypothetical protein